MKYQDESTNVSIVSVSRNAWPAHFGHSTWTQSSAAASGDLPRAVEEFRAALELQPEFVSANRNMATALTQQGRMEEARIYSQKAVAGSTNKLAARQF